MRISSVTAHAFGPFKGESLALTEGMTVVVGDNESGKSSWQAAIYAALCGRRRGSGSNGAVDKEFKRRHQPWSGEDWLVSSLLHLDDGRTIEMRQDLAGKVKCSATDLGIGRDVADEIMVHGSPDASKWLGLDRGSFLTTACVGQADLDGVIDGAVGLQPFLQRAATSAQAGGTAAAAISQIKAFQRDHVGVERSTAVKPLQLAINRREQAVAALGRATADHAEYLTRVERADESARSAADAERALRQCEATVARTEADRRSAVAERAAALQAASGGVPPIAVVAADALDQQVLRALTDFDRRPAAPAVVAPSVAELDGELAALPDLLDGDVESHESVLVAVDRVRRAVIAVDTHRANAPVAPTTALPDVDERELLGLAHTLETPITDVPDDLRIRLAHAQDAATTGAGGRRGWLLAVGSLVVAAGIAAVVLGQPAVGALVAVAGLIAAGLGLMPRRAGIAPGAVADLARAEAAVQSAERDTQRAQQARAAAIARCADLGVDSTPAALRDLALAVANAADVLRKAADHAAQSDVVGAALTQACTDLREALLARGCPVPALQHEPAALVAAAEDYARACSDRARRSTLTARRDAARQREELAESDRAIRAQASAALLDAASACGLSIADETVAHGGLLAWQEQRAGERLALDEAARDWRELQTLLDGRTVDDLQADAAKARQRAADLAIETPDLPVDDALDATRLESLRAASDRARLVAVETATEAREYAERIGSVPDAEEALASAAADLARVRRLDDTLTRTHQFLQKAEEEVHRTIAPLLNASLNEHLATITAGRYTDALVDPEDLSVQVCGATRNWRSAEDLSFGTMEQIYLLLRVALTDHLTRDRDTCPLILDDVTVHADAARTAEILDFLHDLSKDRQVIVFTQERQVAEWARQHLTSDRDAIRELEPIPIA